MHGEEAAPGGARAARGTAPAPRPSSQGAYVWSRPRGEVFPHLVPKGSGAGPGRAGGRHPQPGKDTGIWGGCVHAWPCPRTDTGARSSAALYNKSLPAGPPELGEADPSGGL